AVPAHAARGDERADHTVADRQAAHVAADLLDHARALVPEHHAPGGEGAVDDREVGVAHTARGDADDHVTRPGVERRDLLDRERLGLFEAQCGLHGGSPWWNECVWTGRAEATAHHLPRYTDRLRSRNGSHPARPARAVGVE